MRLLAGEMEKLETIESIEAHRSEAMVSLEQVRETELVAPYEDESPEDWAERMEIKLDFEPEGDDEALVLNGLPETEPEIEIDTLAFNTAARKVNLSDERLRFPAGLTFEERRSLVENHLPNIDARIESVCTCASVK